MPDYIPTNEAEKIQWLTNFAAWLTINGAAHGFTPAEIAAFNMAVADATTAVTDNVTAQAAAKAATTKADAKANKRGRRGRGGRNNAAVAA